MADRKKNRRKFDEDEKTTKEEYAVAKFLRFNVPTKEGKLHNMEVHCFFASAAVDALLESKWSASKNAKEPLFFNRHSCVSYCQKLLQKGIFHRAERVQRKKEKDRGDKSKKKKAKDTAEKEDTGTGDELRERKSKKDKKGKKEKDDVGAEKIQQAEKEGEEKKDEKKEEKAEEKKEENKEEGKKKKKEKPLKLVMTDDQRFLDGEDNVYVWIYDPVNAKTLLIGSLIVLGAIALCLFPLWPEVVRIGVYYISLVAAGFVGFILALVVIRFILFCCIWLLTLGRHHFWLLPNLTEDVGFFDSFRPLYKHDLVTKESSTSASKEKGKSSSKVSKKLKSTSKKKEKSSDKEDSGSEQEEFEMIDKGDVERDEREEQMEGEADTEENGEAVEEEEGGPEEEDYEEEEDEEDQNGAHDEEYDEDGEEEEEEEEEEENSQMKKDK